MVIDYFNFFQFFFFLVDLFDSVGVILVSQKRQPSLTPAINLYPVRISLLCFVNIQMKQSSHELKVYRRLFL